jgi:hypothetical protein
VSGLCGVKSANRFGFKKTSNLDQIFVLTKSKKKGKQIKRTGDKMGWFWADSDASNASTKSDNAVCIISLFLGADSLIW